MQINVINNINVAGIKAETEKRKQKAIELTARAFHSKSEPYVPYSNETKANHMYDTASRSPFNEGKIVYDVPYASAVYNRTGNVNWNRTHHPKATSNWAKYTLEAYKQDLLRVFQNVMRGKENG